MFRTKAHCSFLSLAVFFALSDRSFVKTLNFSYSNALKSFSNYLDYGYHRLGIVVHQGNLGLKHHQVEELFGRHYMQYLRVSSNQLDSDLGKFFDNSFSLSAIFLPPLDNPVINNQILQFASLSGLFNNTNSWYMWTGDNTAAEDFIKENLENLRIEVNADITVVAKGRDSSLILYDVYKICKRESVYLTIEYKGNWTTERGLSILPKFRDGFVRRRRNFCNSTVKTTTALVGKPPGISNLEYLENTLIYRHLDQMQRKTYKLMKNMEPLFNLSLDVKISNSWGEPLENGTWTGAISDVLSKEIQFMICPIRFTTPRAKVITYTPQLHTEHIQFLLRHPRHAAIRNIFFEPLSPTVWWCIMAMTIFLIVQLGVHVREELKGQKLYFTDSTPTHIETRWDFVVLQIFEVIFMQGPSPELYRFISTRTLIMAGCIFSIMLQQFYSAFIVGSLLATPPRTLTTLEALYNSSFEIGMERILYNFELFTNTTNQLIRNTYTKRICRNHGANILSIEQGVERIGRGGFAFYVSLNRALGLLSSQLSESAFCELQEIYIYPPFTIGLGAAKDSIYREHVATGILYFRESGLMQYSEKQWKNQIIDCSLIQNNEVKVDIEHFLPAIFLLAMAIGVSFIALLMEIIMKWLEKQKDKSENATYLEKNRFK